MTIEIKTVIKYEYKCNACFHKYVEQRGLGEDVYFTKCNVANCSGDYELVTQTESTYEQKVSDLVVEETPAE